MTSDRERVKLWFAIVFRYQFVCGLNDEAPHRRPLFLGGIRIQNQIEHAIDSGIQITSWRFGDNATGGRIRRIHHRRIVEQKKSLGRNRRVWPRTCRRLRISKIENLKEFR